MRHSRRSALTLACGLALMTACTGDGGDDPVVLPTTSTTTTSAGPSTPPPTSAAEPTPTTTLVLPDRHVASADAFVQEFFDALNNTKDTGDFTTFDALYVPQCAGCLELRGEIESWLSDGGAVEGGDWIVTQQNSNQLDDGSLAYTNAFAYRSGAVVTPSSGEEHSVPPTDMRWFQATLRDDGGWIVDSLGSTGAG